jgi:hypothetical protein
MKKLNWRFVFKMLIVFILFLVLIAVQGKLYANFYKEWHNSYSLNALILKNIMNVVFYGVFGLILGFIPKMMLSKVSGKLKFNVKLFFSLGTPIIILLAYVNSFMYARLPSFMNGLLREFNVLITTEFSRTILCVTFGYLIALSFERKKVV